MLNFIDNILNSITMYRLVLYYLIFLLAIAFIYSIFHLLPFSPTALLFSTGTLLAVCYIGNKIFERVFNVQTNVESLYITALILALIITPTLTVSGISFLMLAGVVGMASKYLLNIKGKHIFNPASIALVITAFTIHGYASWWVGTLIMFPFTLFGILIVRKIRRFDLIFYFFISAIVVGLGLSFLKGNYDALTFFKRTFFDSPILFFSFVMLTEPLTTPPTKTLQSIYGAVVGLLFIPLHLGGIVTTPEIALSVGNIFSYVFSPKEKLILSLKTKIKLTEDVYDFVFSANKQSLPPRGQKLNFRAGQYLEWTLGHKGTDARGNRRYFTIASSPTENEIRIGIKFPEGKASSYKREMLDMEIGHKIVASQLAGDFTLLKDEKQKLVFVAGGIGVTPYRSMVKYLLDSNLKRDIILIYSETTIDKMVYKEVFDEASQKLGIKVVYYESGKSGRINEQIVQKIVPDFMDRVFYLSGSQGMVKGFEDVLNELKLPKKQVKVDYFPGF